MTSMESEALSQLEASMYSNVDIFTTQLFETKDFTGSISDGGPHDTANEMVPHFEWGHRAGNRFFKYWKIFPGSPSFHHGIEEHAADLDILPLLTPRHFCRENCGNSQQRGTRNQR